MKAIEMPKLNKAVKIFLEHFIKTGLLKKLPRVKVLFVDNEFLDALEVVEEEITKTLTEKGIEVVDMGVGVDKHTTDSSTTDPSRSSGFTCHLVSSHGESVQYHAYDIMFETEELGGGPIVLKGTEHLIVLFEDRRVWTKWGFAGMVSHELMHVLEEASKGEFNLFSEEHRDEDGENILQIINDLPKGVRRRYLHCFAIPNVRLTYGKKEAEVK